MSSHPVDMLLEFAFAMLWRATAVTYVTHLAASLLQLRSRCLARWLRQLLLQADPCACGGRAGAVVDAVLRHPMIGSRSRRGDSVQLEQLVLILQEVAAADCECSAAATEVLASTERLHQWFDQAMFRATRDYRKRVAALTALASLGVVLVTTNADLRGVVALWVPLSLGSPFWYDLLKRMVPLLRTPKAERSCTFTRKSSPATS